MSRDEAVRRSLRFKASLPPCPDPFGLEDDIAFIDDDPEWVDQLVAMEEAVLQEKACGQSGIPDEHVCHIGTVQTTGSVPKGRKQFLDGDQSVAVIKARDGSYAVATQGKRGGYSLAGKGMSREEALEYAKSLKAGTSDGPKIATEPAKVEPSKRSPFAVPGSADDINAPKGPPPLEEPGDGVAPKVSREQYLEAAERVRAAATVREFQEACSTLPFAVSLDPASKIQQEMVARGHAQSFVAGVLEGQASDPVLADRIQEQGMMKRLIIYDGPKEGGEPLASINTLADASPMTGNVRLFGKACLTEADLGDQTGMFSVGMEGMDRIGVSGTHEYGHMAEFAVRREMNELSTQQVGHAAVDLGDFSSMVGGGGGTGVKLHSLLDTAPSHIAKTMPPSIYGGTDKGEAFAESFVERTASRLGKQVTAGFGRADRAESQERVAMLDDLVELPNTVRRLVREGARVYDLQTEISRTGSVPKATPEQAKINNLVKERFARLLPKKRRYGERR